MTVDKNKELSEALEKLAFPESFLRIISDAFKEYSGDVTIFESAVGALFVGKALGWGPLLIIHNPKTIKRYESILKVDFRQIMGKENALSEKSRGYEFVKNAGRFWDGVRGSMPVEERKTVGLDDILDPSVN
jgi:hypothetical protein